LKKNKQSKWIIFPSSGEHKKYLKPQPRHALFGYLFGGDVAEKIGGNPPLDSKLDW